MRTLALSTLALVGAVALTGCSSDPGTFFSTSGIVPGMAGQAAIAGSASAAGANSAGAHSGGAASSGGSPDPGAGGAGEAGAPAAGAAAAGGPSAAGMGGVGGAAPIPEPSACDGKTVTPDALIANFENGVAGWSAYVGSDPFGVESTQPGAVETEHALRFQGGKANTSGFYDLLPCRDVSAFDGLQFWAKGKGGEKVRFLAVIPATDPKPDIGDCHEPVMKCSDHPGKPFTLSNEWKLYQAPWVTLAQFGWGSPATFKGVINAVLWINDGPVEKFDFQIDEVSFYKTASGG